MPVFKTTPQASLHSLVHALRQAWLARRIARVRRFMAHERATHLQQMAQLRAELDALRLHRAQLTAREDKPWRARP